MNAPLPKCTRRLLWTCFHSTVCVRRKTFRSAKSPPTVPSRPPGHQKRVESNCPFRNISRLVAWWDWRTARWSIRFSCRNTARRSKRSVALPVREVCIDLRRKCCCCTSRTQRQLSRWSIQSTKRFCGEFGFKKVFLWNWNFVHSRYRQVQRVDVANRQECCTQCVHQRHWH